MEAVQVRFTLRLKDQWSMWMQYGCNVNMESYMASNGSCFMVTWIVINNHLLEEGLTQNRETMHSEHSQPLIYSILSCVRTRMNKNSLKEHLVEKLVTYDFTLHLRICNHTTRFEGVLRRPLDTFFGLSQLHGHGTWLVCEVARRWVGT